MKILITGSNGMLGNRCVSILSQNNDVIATDIDENSINPTGNITYFQMDITDKDLTDKIISEQSPDYILNCAAYTDVDGSEDNKELAWNINVNGVRNIIIPAKKIGCHIVHISTDYVFDGCKGPYKEDDSTKPINYYGETKLAAEKELVRAGIKWTIIRTNVIYGSSFNQKASFVSWAVSKLKKHETINIVIDQYGNPTWVDGLVMALEKIIEKNIIGLYHYAGKDYLNRFEFALHIADIFSLDHRYINKISTRALGQKAKRPFKAGLKTDKIVKELGVKIFGIIETLQYIKKDGEKSE